MNHYTEIKQTKKINKSINYVLNILQSSIFHIYNRVNLNNLNLNPTLCRLICAVCWLAKVLKDRLSPEVDWVQQREPDPSLLLPTFKSPICYNSQQKRVNEEPRQKVFFFKLH